MPFERINAYRIMWLFVFFDLPTNTKKERHDAARFRNMLEKDGFQMMQYSVYIRHCVSRENLDMHMRKVEALIPEEGYVCMSSITDKQFSDIRNYWNHQVVKEDRTPSLIEFY